MVQVLDDVPETIGKLLLLLIESNMKVIKTPLAFAAHKMQPIFDLIAINGPCNRWKVLVPCAALFGLFVGCTITHCCCATTTGSTNNAQQGGQFIQKDNQKLGKNKKGHGLFPP